ncbi:MAG: LPXTG cell wall anchor domain-containing protein [Marmoricola sp.]
MQDEYDALHPSSGAATSGQPTRSASPGLKPPKRLPNTGGPGVGWIYGGAAMVLLGGGVLLFLRRRNQPEG